MFDREKVTADDLGEAMKDRRTRLAAMLIDDGRSVPAALLEAGRIFDYVAVTCLYMSLLEVPDLRDAVLTAVVRMAETLDKHDFKAGDPKIIEEQIKNRG